MKLGSTRLRCALAAGASALAIATAAVAQTQNFEVPAGDLQAALDAYAQQANVQLLYRVDLVKGVSSRGAHGALAPDEALSMVLADTGLQIRRHPSGAVAIVQAGEGGGPQGGSAGGDVDALIVTAQKREENIQDVPIAISAFSQEDLTRSQVAGGPDLMTQVPNMTFTKTNFSSYSIQIRGIGTQAISATTDPAVAVAFNNTPFIRNRFFEQEFYDLQRVEVLRGPQGTLYGRNATAGVVNIISAKPKFTYEAKLSADVANYNSTRLEGMINVPLVEDVVALRLAGAWTKRDGFVTNEITGNPIDGRDLWSTRMSLRFTPTDRLDVNLIWEHFEEDDDRLRSGKQLCKKDNVTEVGGNPVGYFHLLPDNGQVGGVVSIVQSVFSQGCLPNSLYDEESFQTPNGFSIPYYYQTGAIGLPVRAGDESFLFDPYLSRVQSRDLRSIESTVDPSYRAKSDVFELQVDFDLTDTLSLTSETAWASDFIFSTQDFNRFNTAAGAWEADQGLIDQGILRINDAGNAEFCDPQVGCADRLVAVDLSTATSQHFSQEFRVGSNFEGPFNFSLGSNFLRYDTEDKYYVFINSLSMVAYINGLSGDAQYEPNVSDNYDCLREGLRPPNLNQVYGLNCIYADPNPIDNLNDLGHNYFLSKNPYKLISYAIFGEAYYNLAENLKVTAGLRWTVDKKEAPRVPSWILAGGTVGYPVQDVTEQEWREPTGRLTIDWKPELSFTDETLVYASYAHGYKAGGANPPPYGIVMYCPQCQSNTGDFVENYLARAAAAPRTFDAEFVDAYELGAKNTLFDGRLTLNTAAFYYDYKGYQISQIIDRSAFNQNFDAEVWGLELEADWRPLENLRLGLKLGYENTKVADGERAIDIMDRTAGHDDWVVVRPFPTFPSNCVLPAWLYYPTNREGIFGLGSPNGGGPAGCEWAYVIGADPVTYLPYVDHPTESNGQGLSTWDDYPGFDPVLGGTADDNVGGAHNFGVGFYKDLSGNELPNAPNFTATITADYTIPLAGDWLVNLRTDLYYQSEAWTRIFNMEGYDKLKAYTNVNLAAIFTNEEAGWNIMAYVKNVMDRDSITGAFLNSDDTGLTTNVFLTEPRLYGLRVTKAFQGGPWWTGANPDHTGPYPLTVELGGQVQRHDAPYETLQAGFEDLFPDELNIFAGAQNRDLDWGDGRTVKLTFRPGAGPWTVSASVRYGRTNSDTARPRVEIETESQCAISSAFFPVFGYDICTNPDNYFRQLIGDIDINRATTNWADASARNQEKHELADFTIGRDFGIGGLSRSTVVAGLRHAAFDSETMTTMAGAYDRFVREGWYLPGPQRMPFHERDGSVQAAREFEGAGPTLSWEAAVPLIGGDDTGRVELDWSVGGGVLIGKQETEVSGEARLRDREVYVGTFEVGDGVSTQSVTDLPPISYSRSNNSVTVPVAAISLGLSYEIQRIKLSTGYRWERYFDVLDVGFTDAKDADRTIDGPYFKIAVGFGG